MRAGALAALARRFVAVAAGVAGSCALQAAPASAAVPPSFYGVNAGPVLWTLSEHDLATHLDAIRAAGVGQVRTDSGWHLEEPEAPVDGVHTYDWTYSDRVTAALARAGLAWYALLDYGTKWAGRVPGDALSPPVNLSDYGAYAAAFAARYGPGGTFWRAYPDLPAHPVSTLELWNEPNVIGFWHPAPDARVYADLFAAAADAVARVDPSLRVVVGGLDNTGVSLFEGPAFLSAMLAARPDLAGKVDGVAIHDYNTTREAMLARLEPMRALVDRLLGPGVPLDITEIGWSTAGVLPPTLVAAPVSEETRAELYRGLVDDFSRSDCTLGAIVPYAWLTAEGAPISQTDFFGIADRSGALKPSAVAFKEAILRSESRAAPAAPLDICHRPGAVTPDTPAAPPSPSPPPPPAVAAARVSLRLVVAPRASCRHGRALVRVRVRGVATIRWRVDHRRRRTLAVPPSGILRVRVPRDARRVVATAAGSGGRTLRRTATLRGHCRRASSPAKAAR